MPGECPFGAPSKQSNDFGISRWKPNRDTLSHTPTMATTSVSLHHQTTRLGGTGLTWSIIISMPSVEAARGAFVNHVISQPAEPPKPKPIPAILRRFALIKRAAAPQKGADPQSVQSAFPHWGFPDNFSTDAFVSDLSLAVSALVARLDPPMVEVKPVEPRAKPRPPPPLPPPSPEPADPNALSAEDEEL